MKY
ncbi:unnamed protein product [Cuscuta epithymum]|jgi:hypothetical protein